MQETGVVEMVPPLPVYHRLHLHKLLPPDAANLLAFTVEREYNVAPHYNFYRSPTDRSSE